MKKKQVPTYNIIFLDINQKFTKITIIVIKIIAYCHIGITFKIIIIFYIMLNAVIILLC